MGSDGPTEEGRACDPSLSNKLTSGTTGVNVGHKQTKQGLHQVSSLIVQFLFSNRIQVSVCFCVFTQTNTSWGLV